MNRFKDKTVIVTGAASGIGRATAIAFAGEGANVVIADLDGDKLKDVAGEIENGGSGAVAHQVSDVSDYAQCEALVAFAVERFGALDVLVNNAGKDHLGKLDEGDLSEFTKVIEADLYGVVHMSRASIAKLRETKGAIVNTSSVSGLGGDWNHSFYCAAKGGVTNFTRALAMDEAANGVRVNAVNPSIVYTPFTAGMQDQPDLVKAFETRIPMGRGAEPEDITGPILFLASGEAGFVTGVNLPVDGGLSASNGQPKLS